MVCLVPHETPLDAGDHIGLNHAREQPFLFAIARDARTIFASWNVDWRSIFEKTVPAVQQVHLRLIGGDGAMERKVAVEPMYAMHYVTVTGSQNLYRLEIGYFQPSDTWHSVATSNQVEMPPLGSVEVTKVDLATIPFHISFQKLTDLFGTTNDLSKVASQFQKRMLNGDKPNETTASDKKILDDLNLSLPELAATAHAYKKIDSERLARHTRGLSAFGSTSPSRAF